MRYWNYSRQCMQEHEQVTQSGCLGSYEVDYLQEEDRRRKEREQMNSRLIPKQNRSEITTLLTLNLFS